MIPPLNEDGLLPPGIHWTRWPEFRKRFGLTTHRKKLIQGLIESSQKLAAAGCRTIYIDGSFVTSKEHPGDFDACWDLNNVDFDNLDPVFLDFANRRAAQKAQFFGEWFPADLPNGISGLSFLEFFQIDKPSGKAKGIIAIALASHKSAKSKNRAAEQIRGLAKASGLGVPVLRVFPKGGTRDQE